jgi:hypothetical protein
VSLADYLSTDGWAVSYAFVKAGTQKVVTATSQADGTHLAAIAADDSNWSPGTYRWQKYATKLTQRVTVATGEIIVDTNFAAQTAGYDGRSHAVRALEAIEATLERRASTDHLNFSIDTGNGSRAVGRMLPAQLMVMRDRYQAMVDNEKTAELIAKGMGAPKILFRTTGA